MTTETEHKKLGWRWLRILGALLFGSLLLMMILPSTGCLYNPELNRLVTGMWHFGPFLFFPDALIYIGLITISSVCVICGALWRNKIEIVGWGLLGFVLLGLMLLS
ncbi:MAG TPA: hypothetical protein VMH87_09310 [Pseudomonadales bacterium]|nr:hypothetical protein [Pseudomonadales bacterium]